MAPKKIDMKAAVTPKQLCRAAKYALAADCIMFMIWFCVDIAFIVDWLRRMFVETTVLALLVLVCVLAPLFRSAIMVRNSIDRMRKACSMTTPTQ